MVTASVTVAPVALLFVAMRQAWNEDLHWYDLVVFAVTYVPIGLGVTIGFHRHLTHRRFKTSPFLRGVLAALGSAAIEGPVISWVANHRKHHAFSDLPGDPHSPHVDHGLRWRGELRGLAHAHVGWLFLHGQRAATERYASDLLADPVIRFVSTTSLLWVLLGLAVPFGLEVAIGGSVTAGLTGLLWGGAVRVFVRHHVTYSINSLCHYYGHQQFETATTPATSLAVGGIAQRSLAQQPPRLPHLSGPQTAPTRTRPLRTRHHSPRTHRPHLGRHTNQPRTPSRPSAGLSGQAHGRAQRRASQGASCSSRRQQRAGATAAGGRVPGGRAGAGPAHNRR